MLPGAFRTKDLNQLLAAANQPHTALKRTLGAFNVTMLGVGAAIGAGIFATIGTAAAGDALRPGAGPSLMLSFFITAVVCGFTALCYAEFASMVPISGSAYTYAYSTLGEFIAWIIGWDLIIEYAIGNVAVAISWANYFRALLETIGIHVPLWLATDYRTAAAKMPEVLESAPHIFGIPIVCNLLAFFIVMAVTAVLVIGIKESANLNVVMVIIKIIVLMFFVGAGLYFVTPSEMATNWVPFQPNGWGGTFAGAAVVFFAFIGFDAVSTVAEETRNPARDVPVGIIASLIICSVLYAVVAAVFTGLIPYESLKERLATEQAEPLTMAISHVAPGVAWVKGIIAFGAVIANTAVLLVFQLGQPRIFFSMARDGLLPKAFTHVHPKYRTPHVTTIVTGLIVGVLASFASIDEMVDLTNIGTLFAFVLVCVGIPILRFRDPDRRRAFRVPGGPFLLPLLGAISCVGLMFYLPPSSWWRFAGWLLLGMAVYTAYGYTRSAIGRQTGRPQKTTFALMVASIGFLLMASGLFAIPHDASPLKLVELARGTGSPGNASAFIGLCLAGSGFVAAMLGVVVQRARG